MSQQLKTENVRGLCAKIGWKNDMGKLVSACTSMGLQFECNTLTEGRSIWARPSQGGIYVSNGIDDRIFTEVPTEEFITKLLAPLPPQPTTPFAEQVAANIIKISCNNKTPYADKMKMVVEAILEFERDPKNKKA